MHSSVTTSSLFFLLFILSLRGPTTVASVDTIQTTLQFLPHLPKFSPGGGFAKETINLGGLLLKSVTTYRKIWATNEGAPSNDGATFYEPIGIPRGFSCLGFYGQPNNIPLYGHVLVGKDVSNETSKPTLKSPVDYHLRWSSKSLNFTNESEGYIWLPVAPRGYKAIGYVITNVNEKPSLDKVSCVHEDLIQIPKRYLEKNVNDMNGLNFHHSIHGFTIEDEVLPESCDRKLIVMPNMEQVHEVMTLYSPVFYYHPEEKHLPSSVDWYFTRGLLLDIDGDDHHQPLNSDGSNLPQGGTSTKYHISLPSSESSRNTTFKGNLQSALAYVHVKPALSGLFTDIAIWTFSPFNSPVTINAFGAHIASFDTGDHIGDWEHVTLRINNINGCLDSIYFAAHGFGERVKASALEVTNTSKPVVYFSKDGHGAYSTPGNHTRLEDPVTLPIGLLDITSISDIWMDTGARYMLVAAEYLENSVTEPLWLNYLGKWGPDKNSPVGPKPRGSWTNDE